MDRVYFILEIYQHSSTYSVSIQKILSLIQSHLSTNKGGKQFPWNKLWNIEERN
jgi:hypothetical protein